MNVTNDKIVIREVVRIVSAGLAVLLTLNSASMVRAAQDAGRFTDNDILEAVELEFRADDAITPDTIDVRVNYGIVSLDGTVFTLLSKRQAVRSVGSLKGVRAIVNKIRVTPTSRSNEEILADVNSALRTDPAVNRNALKITADGPGVVRLSGTAGSFSDRMLTESVVAGVRGVTDIDNHIKIDSNSDRSADEIESEVLRRFELNPYLAEGLIDVQVEGKKVVLSGTVGSVNEKDLAKILCWISGVDQVDVSQLKVDSSHAPERRREKFIAFRSDIELQKAVSDSLLYDSRVRSGDVKVTAKYGAISLTGSVATLAAKQAAKRDAMNTIGVRRVINNLKVRVDRWPGDIELTKQADAAIARDAHLSQSELSASSHFGKMYIRGEVNTYFEKNRVGAVLADIPGVKEIVNRVKLDSDWNEKPDEDILEDANRRLRWSPFLNAEDISVLVDDGVVILKGKVDTWHDRKDAAHHARQAGARRVKNQLKVRSARDIPHGLKATLVTTRSQYVLSAAQRGEQFRRFLEHSKPFRDSSALPPPPEVVVTLKVRNENATPYRIRLGHDAGEIELSLTGEGAVHVPIQRTFVADFRQGREVVIPPGESLDIPIQSLRYGFRNESERWYWTEPGEYMLQATLIWPQGISAMRTAAVSAPPVKLSVSTK